jgi:hypothetical protein
VREAEGWARCDHPFLRGSGGSPSEYLRSQCFPSSWSILRRGGRGPQLLVGQNEGGVDPRRCRAPHALPAHRQRFRPPEERSSQPDALPDRYGFLSLRSATASSGCERVTFGTSPAGCYEGPEPHRSFVAQAPDGQSAPATLAVVCLKTRTSGQLNTITQYQAYLLEKGTCLNRKRSVASRVPSKLSKWRVLLKGAANRESKLKKCTSTVPK